MTYPKFGYHATKEPIIIRDAAHHKALGPGYYDTPTLLAAASEVEEPSEHEALADKPKRPYNRKQKA